jgi:hypothetical protein
MLIPDKYSNIENRVIAILLILPMVMVEIILLVVLGILLIPYMIFRNGKDVNDCPKWKEASGLLKKGANTVTEEETEESE